MVDAQEVMDLLEELSFEAAWHDEDLGQGVRVVAIEDPRGQGIGVNLVWTGQAVVATLGHGTVVDLPGEPSVSDLRALLTDLLGWSSVERWSRTKHQLKVNSAPEARTFSSSKGFFGGPLSDVRHYTPYRQRHGTDREPR